MPARTSLPTGDEIQRLAERVSRDPGSPAFVELGEAYVALARPREAIDVGVRGLHANPDSVEGRLMVSRAFAMMHRWKEAQVELLRVVKADRRNYQGFRLLGEVLMRRADYERALPVLQHAQNLNPADPSILAMLKRARDGRPLDPPLPVPASGTPRGSSAPEYLDDEPTRVADDRNALGRVTLEQVAVRGDAAAVPREGGVRRSDARGNEDAQFKVTHHQPPPPEDPFAPLDSDHDGARGRMPLAAEASHEFQAAPAAKAASVRPPVEKPTVRPRVMSGEKRDKGMAEVALKQSAAVGEQYLNNLLTNGLLDVPNVNLGAAGRSTVRPEKPWGRSYRRVFAVLFSLLFLGAGGGAGWFYYTTQEQQARVKARLADAQAALLPGTHAGLEAGRDAAMEAIDIDRESASAVAVWAELAAVEQLLYGGLQSERIDQAISTASRQLAPGDPGAGPLAVARIAHELEVVPRAADPVAALAETQRKLAAELKAHPDELLLPWLAGVAQIMAGQLEQANTSFQQADATGQGPLAARVGQADLLADEGQYEQAQLIYDDVLRQAKGHPLAHIGSSLARTERSAEPAEAIGELNVGLSDDAGPRVAAYKSLAMAAAQLEIDNYEEFTTQLAAASGAAVLSEPRYLARLALLQLRAGEVKGAARSRQAITWYSEEPAEHPLVRLLDAELLLARGLPAAAEAKLSGVEGLRAHELRGRALLEQGKAGAAVGELDAALELAPESGWLPIWREAARLIADSGARREADGELDKLGRASVSKVPRYAHGMALLAIGRVDEARARLEQSVDDLSDEFPNAFAYRAHAQLAQLDLATDNLDGAAAHVEAALEQNPGYLPARALKGRVSLLQGDAASAVELLAEAISAETASAADELAYAQALVKRGGMSVEDRSAAKDAVRRAAKKGASRGELEQVAPQVDAALAKELGVN